MIKKLISLFQTETEEITAQVANWTNTDETSLWHKQMMLMALLSINDTSIIMIMLFMTFLTCMFIHAISFTHDNYSQIIQSDRSVPFSTDDKLLLFCRRIYTCIVCIHHMQYWELIEEAICYIFKLGLTCAIYKRIFKFKRNEILPHVGGVQNRNIW